MTKLTLRPFQEIGVENLLSSKRRLLRDEMGCLSGDTFLKVARGRNGTATRRWTLENLFKAFNGIGKRSDWDVTVPMYIKAFTGKELKLHHVKGVFFSGNKEVFEIKTERGYTIKATADHRFLTSNGYVPLSNLRTGSKVFVNGTKYINCKTCGNKRKVGRDPLVHPELCSKCARAKGNERHKTTSKGLPLGKSYDKNGYVLVMCKGHPSADRQGRVREHVLVMEKHLGRYLKYPADVVHHINGVRGDNRIDNLELCSQSEHSKLHSETHKRNISKDKHGNKVWWEPEIDRIVSKKYVGKEDTYDISMEDPYHNFVASGFLVHNCGKSVQVLGGIDALLTKVDRVNVLIVCPAALCLMWEKMISDWFASECQVVLMKKQGKEVVKFSGVKVRAVIVSYNYLQKPGQVERLKKCRWGVVVADEAHKLKSWGKKTSKGFQTLVKNHEGYVWMLTGSPATNSGQDYYVYLQTCEPGRHGSYLQFSERFCEKTINWFTRKWEYKGVKKDKRAELSAIFKRLGLRRKLEEVAPELPAKIFTDIPVAMPESVVKKFLELKKMYAIAIEAGDIPRELPGELADLRLEIGLIKSEVAVEYVLNAGRPMIVFTQRIETADKISSSLMEQGIRVGKITGAESGVEKDSSVTRFQNGELDVIVANIAAGGVGLTLTRANTVLFAELTSSPAEEGQAIGRINRIGQKAKVLQIIKLIGEKSVDSSIEKSLLYKGEFMSEVMGD